jgi:putative oxidoreductase
MAIVNFLRNFYQSLISTSNVFQDVLLFAMRLFWGYLFFQSGLGKLSHIGEVGDYFQTLGIPLGHLNAYIAAWIEMAGGLCLMAGFASRLVAVPLTVVMIVAYLTAHFDTVRTLFTTPSDFTSQSAFNFLLTALIVFAFGPGKFSVDYILECLTRSKK